MVLFINTEVEGVGITDVLNKTVKAVTLLN
jgi:hypothetical protein